MYAERGEENKQINKYDMKEEEERHFEHYTTKSINKCRKVSKYLSYVDNDK